MSTLACSLGLHQLLLLLIETSITMASSRDALKVLNAILDENMGSSSKGVRAVYIPKLKPKQIIRPNKLPHNTKSTFLF
jgi:hypothetical protein